MDTRAPHRERPALPAGSGRVHGAGVYPPLPGLGGRRDGAGTHQRPVECGRAVRRAGARRGLRLVTGRAHPRVRRAARYHLGPPLPGVPDLCAGRSERRHQAARLEAGVLGQSHGLTGRAQRGVHRLRFHRPHPPHGGSVRDGHRRFGYARRVQELRSRSRGFALGAGRKRDLLRGGRPRVGQPALRRSLRWRAGHHAGGAGRVARFSGPHARRRGHAE